MLYEFISFTLFLKLSRKPKLFKNQALSHLMKSMWTSATVTTILAFAFGVNAENLLVNGSFEAQNSGFTSGYTYVASGMSAVVGTFGIRTSSTDFNNGYTPFNDHTTGSGYMMLLDGAPDSGTVGWSESVTVQPNHTYYFSAWVAASDGSNPASLRFTINGSPVSSDLALSATAGVWQNFTVSWDSGANTNATITISDDNTISLGNDFALDDLSFGSISTTPVAASIHNAVEIDWASQVGVNYQVQYATAANTNIWFNLGGSVAGNGTTNLVFDSTRFNPQRFYRVLTVQ